MLCRGGSISLIHKFESSRLIYANNCGNNLGSGLYRNCSNWFFGDRLFFIETTQNILLYGRFDKPEKKKTQQTQLVVRQESTI